MRLVMLATAAALIASPVLAQTAPTTTQPTTGIVATPAPLIRAIEEMLNAETRRYVASRVNAQNPINEVLETILLNSLQQADARGMGARIVAIDFARQVAVVDMGTHGQQVIRFNRETLQIVR